MDYQQNSTRTRSTLAPSKSGPGLSVRQGNRVPLGEISANTKSGLENKRPVKSQVITAICFCFASHLNRCRFSPPLSLPGRVVTPPSFLPCLLGTVGETAFNVQICSALCLSFCFYN